jgi:hypothetical protein
MDPETFEVVRLNETGERYARRKLAGDVTGVYGPLREGEATESALPHLDYSAELAEWFMGKYIVGSSIQFSYVAPDAG